MVIKRTWMSQQSEQFGDIAEIIPRAVRRIYCSVLFLVVCAAATVDLGPNPSVPGLQSMSVPGALICGGISHCALSHAASVRSRHVLRAARLNIVAVSSRLVRRRIWPPTRVTRGSFFVRAGNAWVRIWIVMHAANCSHEWRCC